jgi:hypothetical protein
VAYVESGGSATLKISISEINQKATYWGEFYYSGIPSYWYYLAVVSPFILILLFFVWRHKKAQNNKSLNFTSIENKLLTKLLSLQPDDYLTTNDINTILEADDKSQENQRRIRFNVIGQLNTKLKLKIGNENGIVRKSLPEDKRLTIYVLDQGIIGDLKRILHE